MNRFLVETEGGRPLGAMIAIEGADGSGKSTLVKALHERLAAEDVAFDPFVFPSKIGEVGKLIRRSFTGEIKLDEATLAYLMCADALDWQERLSETMTAGRLAICDRYPTISSWAYQTECMSLDTLLAVQQRNQLHQPDMVFVLDVPPEVAAQRMAARAEERNVIFEKDDLPYRRRLRNRYVGYAYTNREHTALLDAEESTESMVDFIWSSLNENFSYEMGAAA